MRKIAPIAVALVVLLALGSLGCKRSFKAGAYSVASVWQITRHGDEESHRSQLQMKGSAGFLFNADGTFFVEFLEFGVGPDRPCSGNYDGTWEVHEDKLRLLRDKSTLRRSCRPDKERIYLWERGWGGSLNIEWPWEDNIWIQYRLEAQ